MKKVDYTGTRFGRCVAVEYLENTKNGGALYRMVCDCGNTFNARISNLRSGHTRSCGCLSLEKLRERNTLPETEASFNAKFLAYKYSANKRGIQFNLSRDEFKSLTKGNCVYCGCPPTTEYHVPGSNGNYIYNGVDRKDPSGPYSIENCASCCSSCNFSKYKLTAEDFLKKVKEIYEYNNLSSV